MLYILTINFNFNHKSNVGIGNFSRQPKIAKIIPLYKKGNINSITSITANFIKDI